MAAIAGRRSSFKVGSVTVALQDEWQFDESMSLQENTAFGDVGKTFAATLTEFSGKSKGRLDASDTTGQLALRTAMLAGTETAVTFNLDGTHAYTGTVLIKQISVKTAVAGLAEISIDYQGTGVASYS